MKKIISAVLIFTLMLTVCCPPLLAEQSTQTQVKLPVVDRIIFAIDSTTMEHNGITSEIKAPYLDHDITFVPVRAITEAFGASVSWDEESKGVGITKDDTGILMNIGRETAVVNGVTASLAAAPRIHEDTTMVPLRIIAEAFGADVSYDDKTQKIMAVLRTADKALPIDPQMLADIKSMALQKTAKNNKRFNGNFPEATVNGIYKTTDKPGWVSGFYTGLNYLCYDMSGDTEYVDYAKKVFGKLEDAMYSQPTVYNGFTFMLAHYQDYAHTGNEKSKKVVLDAANILMGRIKNPGYIQAFNVWGNNEFARENEFRMVVDSMCTIPILFRATEFTGDKKYYDAAVKQSKLTQKYLVREGFTTSHTFVFHSDGTPKYQKQYQGYSDTSCWARGQAWVINGMAVAYKETGDISFLQTAKNCADTYLKMTDRNFVPRWDLIFTNDDMQEKDTSAASIIACGLMDIWEATEDDFYKDTAYKILTVLYERYSSKNKPWDEGLINEGVENKPSNKNVNCALIYGDYYFVQLTKRFLDLEK